MAEAIPVNQAIDIADVMPLARATGLFVSSCTIQQWDGTLTASGAPDKSAANWDNVTGLVGIACMAAPSGLAYAIHATERKALEEILSTNFTHVLLDDFYAGIETQMRAVIDGTVYDILGVESDSQSQMTRLNVRIATI